MLSVDKGKIRYLHCYWRSNALSSVMKIKKKIFQNACKVLSSFTVVTDMWRWQRSSKSWMLESEDCWDIPWGRVCGFQQNYVLHPLASPSPFFIIVSSPFPSYSALVKYLFGFYESFRGDLLKLLHLHATQYPLCVSVCVSNNLFVHVASYPVSLSTKSHSKYTTKADLMSYRD